jgi:nucleoside-diphosphate-sugar epimerase
MDFNRINGTDVRIIRIFNTYGPFMRAHDGRAIPEFITNALHNNELCINGSGEQTRSFMYIDDLISAIQSYLSMPNAGIGPINIGNPNEEHSIAELAKLIITLTGSKSSVVNHDSLADDPKKRRPNIKKARNLLKWEPTIGLQQGLLKTIEYFRNND